ncbi:hypothetical protein ACJX0J_018338, partial [Zea mays]
YIIFKWYIDMLNILNSLYCYDQSAAAWNNFKTKEYVDLINYSLNLEEKQLTAKEL